MDDIFGLSWKKLLETVLAVLALIFILIDGKIAPNQQMGLLAILVVVYLSLVIILGIARRIDMLGAGGQIAMESAFGILLIIYTIVQMGEDKGGSLTIAALIMDLIVGIMFLIFIIF